MIEIWTEELFGDWRWDADKYIGGTPEFIVETAKVLAKENEVIVYYDGKSMYIEGVYFIGRSSYCGNDIVLACNSRPPKNGKYTIYYTNWFHQRQENCLDYDERIVLSKYHQSIFGQNSRIVSHSCWPQQFDNPQKIKGKCLYSSSPDRGLDFLFSFWPEVELITGAKLIHTYSKNISEYEMIEHYKTSEFWLHPGKGIELFCISAVKAQVAKCIPIFVPSMALAETVRFGVQTTTENFKADLISAIQHPPAVMDVDFGNWETATKELFKNVEVFA